MDEFQQAVESYVERIRSRLLLEPHHTLEGSIGHRFQDRPELDFVLHIDSDSAGLRVEAGRSDAAMLEFTTVSEYLPYVVKSSLIDFRYLPFPLSYRERPGCDLVRFVMHILSTPPAYCTAMWKHSAQHAAARIAQKGPALSPLRCDNDEAAVAAALRERIPVVISGALADWPASAWTPQHLERRCSELNCVGIDAGTLFSQPDVPVPPYLRGPLLPEALIPEMGRLPGFPPQAFLPPRLWAGPRSKTQPVGRLHRDGYDSFLAHLVGVKRALLYGPEQAEYVYPARFHARNQPSWVRTWDPDLTRHPKFRDARPLEIILTPGQLLVIPAGWFHEVHVLEDAISVGYFLRDAPYYPAPEPQ